MESYPISSLLDGAKSAGSGVFAFFVGLVGGSGIVFSQGFRLMDAWTWYLCAWIILIPYTIALLWGLLLAPILGIIFYGLVWNEWNRLIGASLVAILLSTTTLICAKHNPLTTYDGGLSFFITMGAATICLLTGILWETKWKKKTIQHAPREECVVPPRSSGMSLSGNKKE